MPKQTTILCIDDHDAIVSTLPRVLQTAGFKVISATNALDGLNAMQKDPVDMVLLDHSLSEVDGTSIAEHIKLLSPRTIVLIHSGNLEIAAHLPRSVDGFIPKPTVPLELIAKVNEWLAARLAS